MAFASLLPILLVVADPLLPSQAVVQHRWTPPRDGLEAVEIAANLQDPQALAEALTDRDVPGAARAWHRALRAEDEADLVRALQEARRRRSQLRRPEADLSAVFDRFAVEALLEAGRVREARAWLEDPLGEHEADDPVWTALEGGVLLAQGELSNATLRLDQAWRRADGLQRRHRAFARRALAHVAAGDPTAGAESWLAWVGGLRRGAEKDKALGLWDAHPVLAEAVTRASLRPEAADWLAGQARREEALELASSAWEGGDDTESRKGYLVAAEQLYRLRRHDELTRLLEQRRPQGLDAEEEAALDAYPWGVRRRAGADAAVARGFDEVVQEHAGTRRAVEALWEAAWMWELAGHEETAEARFLRYAVEHPDAPFAAASALRALYLPWRRGDCATVRSRLSALEPALGEERQEAAALWIAERCGDATEDLETRHPDTPLRPRFAVPWERRREPAPAGLADSLFAAQCRAFARLADALEAGDPFAGWSGALARADLLYRWGLLEEGDASLEEAAEGPASDDASRLRCVAVAFAHGRSERQARLAWRIQHRLRDRDAGLDRALDLIYHPTPYVDAVLAAAVGEGLPAGLLWGLMRRESFFEADVVSRAGAYGLMQLLPTTAARMARVLGEEPGDDPRALFDPRRNLRYGTVYLSRLLEESGGDPFQALAAYNAGESNGARWKARMPDGAPPEEMLLLISYSETRAYVYHVLRGWQLYGRIHPLLGRWDGLGPS